MEGEGRTGKRRIWLIVLCLSLLLGIVCAGRFFCCLLQQEEAKQTYQELRQEVVRKEPDKEKEPSFTEVESEKETKQTPILSREDTIDFGKLTEINPEICAWIRIPNTEIDYPIARHEGEDDYYLTHNLYGELEFSGCLYMEKVNAKNFTDFNTVIYGHNMRNGSMFRNLHFFEDAGFFKENPHVYLYTPEEKRTYEIFAAYVYDDRHLINAFDFKQKEVRQLYLDEIYKRETFYGNLRTDRKVTTEDHILTLSTCISGNIHARYLVQAVLLDDEETGG